MEQILQSDYLRFDDSKEEYLEMGQILENALALETKTLDRLKFNEFDNDKLK